MPTKTIPTTESTAIPQPRLALTREEAASVLGVSASTIDRLTERGLLKPSRATRRPLYPVWDIERFLKESQGKSPA
jgi:excisionase family DNA binding protein